MKHLKLFYPNNRFWKSGFHWGLCGKKVLIPGTDQYYLEVSPSARFFEIDTGKTFRFSKKQRARLLIAKTITSHVWDTIKRHHLNGLMVESEDQEELSLAWCPSVDFIILEGLREVKDSRKCPLLRFVRNNNTQLREINPQIPTCQELDSLLQKKSCVNVCQTLAKILYSK